MSQKSLKVALAISLALTIAIIPLMGSGCARGGTTGDSGESKVKVGFSICYTGVAAEKGRPMGNAKLDCMKYVNEELGGVAGHEIEVVWRDNEYDAAKAVTIINELIDKDCLFFTTNASKMMGASMEIANRVEFPGFSVFSAPALTHPPQHIYGQMPDYGDDWAAFARYSGGRRPSSRKLLPMSSPLECPVILSTAPLIYKKVPLESTLKTMSGVLSR